jgi:hypothetical protein
MDKRDDLPKVELQLLYCPNVQTMVYKADESGEYCHVPYSGNVRKSLVVHQLSAQ